MDVSEGESGFLPELELPSSPSRTDEARGPSLLWLDSRDLTSACKFFMSMCLKIRSTLQRFFGIIYTILNKLLNNILAVNYPKSLAIFDPDVIKLSLS
jgi:hypothetical protein